MQKNYGHVNDKMLQVLFLIAKQEQFLRNVSLGRKYFHNYASIS
jgi:hypothetical protein